MTYSIIGLMSGTSMDGLDIAHVLFENEKASGNWRFELKHAKTYAYTDLLVSQLKYAKELSGYQLKVLDNEIGRFIGEQVNAFLHEFSIEKSCIDAVSSHGHTIFHQPDEGITMQIGNGQLIATLTGIPTLSNFREKDVAYGGQGAPLVPVGDLQLFSQYADSFLNLGGFANVTVIKGTECIAFDISPCNLLLNLYASLIGYPYDYNGNIGRSIHYRNSGMVELLNGLDYYNQSYPKSLGAEWLEEEFIPKLDIDELTAQEKLKICYDHISDQIAKALNQLNSQKVFVTGGGAKNTYLIELIKEKSNVEIVIPSLDIIDFKESIVFAFLGLLYFEKQPNCLKSVTGARENVIGGVKFMP
jgi:anhydro-N-acetylmuramic acid kinase